MEALVVDFLPLREDRVEGLIADFRCQCAIGRTMTDKYIRTGCLRSTVPNVSVQRVSEDIGKGQCDSSLCFCLQNRDLSAFPVNI